MQRLVLIDGNAILHRAYHALPPLTSKNGEVVNAVYGFFSMFLKIVSDLKPAYIIVCFDRPKPTFRKALYVGYQALRPKMTDDLSGQIGIVHTILEKMKVSLFEVDGYEADDLIGTIARQGVEGKLDGDLQVIIVSGDRDLLQLVNARVLMLAPVVGITNMVLYDQKRVEEKYGLLPSQIIDYKALVGDASDNYPGVSGIGPKTASGLLKKYKTFENLYKHIEDLPEKIGKRLATDAEQASLAKKLATIEVNAPITLDIEKCDMLHFDMNGARAAFEELGFKSLLKKFEEAMDKKSSESEAAKKKTGKKDNGQLGFLQELDQGV